MTMVANGNSNKRSGGLTSRKANLRRQGNTSTSPDSGSGPTPGSKAKRRRWFGKDDGRNQHQVDSTDHAGPIHTPQKGKSSVVLQESTKDSAKKERSFIGAARAARQKNPLTQDPPSAEESSVSSTPHMKAEHSSIHVEGAFPSAVPAGVSVFRTSPTGKSSAGSSSHFTPLHGSSPESNNHSHGVTALSDAALFEEWPSATTTTFQQHQHHYSQSHLHFAADETDSRASSSRQSSSVGTLQLQPSHEEKKTEEQAARSPAGNQVKAILSRPLGRMHLPIHIARKYVVEVSSPEWDADEQLWKYRVLVQQRKQSHSGLSDNRSTASTDTPTTVTSHASQQAQSFTTAFTWRSLADFVWLEEGLRLEFQGSLLIPLLSIAIGAPADANMTGMPVEAEGLRNWLADVLNGVRGQGEWCMTYPVDIMESEAMEAFLYKSSMGSLEAEILESIPAAMLKGQPAGVGLGRGHSVAASHTSYQSSSSWAQPPSSSARGRNSPTSSQQNRQESFVSDFFTRGLEFFPQVGEFCVGAPPAPTSVVANNYSATPLASNTRGSQRANAAAARQNRLPFSSRALGSAPSLEVLDSFAESSTLASPRFSNGLVIHSELIEAQKDLLLNYRITALSAMDKSRILTEAEEAIAASWKRVAVSLANLFSYEKDVENAKLGDLKVKRENVPFRKVTKSIVDDNLRNLARAKTERSTAAIKALQAMLTSYVVDLSSVEPSVTAYFTAVSHLIYLKEEEDAMSRKNGPGLKSQPPLRSVISHSSSSSSWERATQAVRAFVDSAAPGEGAGTGEKEEEEILQRKAWQSRVLIQERHLCQSLTSLCRATPVRVSRMAWRYMNTEATQCATVHSAAHALRSKLNITSKESVSKMTKRHLLEAKEDDAKEADLVTRILNIRNNSKFTHVDEMKSVDGDPQVELDEENEAERERAERRERAVRYARERLGRWDAKLGWAIMEAVGIDDPIVRMEEATRDLKLISKYATGLQECLNRCVDAIEELRGLISRGIMLNKSSIEQSQDTAEGRHIRETRKMFMDEIAKLFSAKYIDHDERIIARSAMPSISVLKKSGVDLSDPYGWSAVHTSPRTGSRTRHTQSRVGDLALAYVESRDLHTEWLLPRLTDLLQDYQERVQVVEGFLYMQCVGIKIEKHFNEQRTKALTAFERKTDITSAINVATRKRLPQLVRELEAKLDTLGPDVSHTVVKETKELHLESKAIKAEIQDLAVRRLLRARESSTEKAISLILFWAKEEETLCASELRALGEAMAALEKQVGEEGIESRSLLSVDVNRIQE